MNPQFQNPFGMQLPAAPGRVVTRIKRYVSPTGQVVEIRSVTVTVLDDQGIFRTEDIIEVVPPLADGVQVEDTGQIRECSRCVSVISVNTYMVCPRCHCGVCLRCTVTNEKQSRQVCVDCDDEIRHPLLCRVDKLIWG